MRARTRAYVRASVCVCVCFDIQTQSYHTHTRLTSSASIIFDFSSFAFGLAGSLAFTVAASCRNACTRAINHTTTIANNTFMYDTHRIKPSTQYDNSCTTTSYVTTCRRDNEDLLRSRIDRVEHLLVLARCWRHSNRLRAHIVTFADELH
jgi:hypothetical protein